MFNQLGAVSSVCEVAELFHRVPLYLFCRKNEASVNLKTGHFDNIDSTVIISSV